MRGSKITLSGKQMEDALRATGSRLTKPRKAILDYLASTKSHPSATQVFKEARKKYPGLSLATVYNTLDTLIGTGLIKVMDFRVRDNRHETNLEPHINLICTSCGAIQDFEERVRVHAEKAREHFGFEVEDCRMEYYGLCASCSAGKKE